MRKLIVTVSAFLVMTGCSFGGQGTKQVSTNEKNVVISLLKPLERGGIKIKEIKKLEKTKLEGFETYLVDLIDNKRKLEIKRYIFVNPQHRQIVLQAFEYDLQNGKLRIKPITPKNSIKSITTKQNIKFLKSIESELNKANIPHVVGKSDKKIYIVWDVLCPFCYPHFNQIEKIAKENNVEIHMIPLAVHGEMSLKGLVYYTKLARKDGVSEALKKLYNIGNGNFEKYVDTLAKQLNKEKQITKDQDKIIKTLKDVESVLLKNQVHATPTIIYVPPGSNTGYVHVGFIPIKKMIEENK